jgi:hypothetical protein
MAIRDKQTIFDLAIERYGGLDFSSELVSLNRVSFDSDLPISSNIISDDIGKGDEDVKKSYKELNYRPVND